LNPDTVSADSKAFDSRAINSKTGGFKSSPPAFSDPNLREEEVKQLADRIAFPATRANIELLAAVLKVIKKNHAFGMYGECCEFLEECVKTARSRGDLKLEFKPRFFLGDGDYEGWCPLPKQQTSSQLSQASLAPPECIVGKCKGCGRPKFEGSSWKDSDYCADSCRDAHERGAA